MKRFSLLMLAISFLSIATFAQSPNPSVATTPSPSINQTVAAAVPGPTAESKGIPNLPWVVEIFASGVMLASVIGALWSLKRAKTVKGSAIGPRHIQFVSVCLIVPTILILGLEKVLTSETTATLIGGLAGYLLSGIGKWEPNKKDDPPKDESKHSPSPVAPKPGTEPPDNRTKAERDYDKLRAMKAEHPGIIFSPSSTAAEPSSED